MKKIIFFAYDLNIGGIEKFYNVTLVLEKNEGTLKKDLSLDTKIIEHKISNCKFILLRKLINFSKRLIFTLKHKNKYDFSCAYTTYQYSAVKLSKICSKNSSIYVHSDYTNLYNKEDFINFFNTRNISEFRKILFVSNQSQENFLTIYPSLKDKTLVINNLVNQNEIIEKSKEEVEIKKERTDIIFAFVGRLVEESKKISRLLECFKLLIEKNKNIKLWIIGDGEEYNKTESFIKNNNIENNIIMYGSQKNPYKYMKESNYIILTSDYEGFPVVFNEASILNKPILSTLDISDDYYRIDDRHGFKIPKDPKLMAKKIEEIMKINLKLNNLDYNELNKLRINKLKAVIENEI